MKTRRRWFIPILLILLIGVLVGLTPLRRYTGWCWRRLTGGASVEERLQEFGPAVRERLLGDFTTAGVTYPPAELVLVRIKDQKILEIWGRNPAGPFAKLRSYPILAASGTLGPKLRSGDQQVPEGIYAIESLHPNSLYHLALRVNYPNEYDRKRAMEEGRGDLGGDIMIHGSDDSVGCLAMGDTTAEDLFVLVADTGLDHTKLILTPTDFRIHESSVNSAGTPAWREELYSHIRSQLCPLGR